VNQLISLTSRSSSREVGHDDECGVASSDAAAIGCRGALVIGFDVSAREWAKAPDRARQLARGFPLFDGVLHTDTASTAAVADQPARRRSAVAESISAGASGEIVAGTRRRLCHGGAAIPRTRGGTRCARCLLSAAWRRGH
jgi:hypothetical protein